MGEMRTQRGLRQIFTIFYGCRKLKTLVIRSSQIKSFGKGALKKTYAKMKVSVPKAAKKKYKKLLKKAGISKKAKIR